MTKRRKAATTSSNKPLQLASNATSESIFNGKLTSLHSLSQYYQNIATHATHWPKKLHNVRYLGTLLTIFLQIALTIDDNITTEQIFVLIWTILWIIRNYIHQIGIFIPWRYKRQVQFYSHIITGILAILFYLKGFSIVISPSRLSLRHYIFILTIILCESIHFMTFIYAKRMHMYKDLMHVCISIVQDLVIIVGFSQLWNYKSYLLYDKHAVRLILCSSIIQSFVLNLALYSIQTPMTTIGTNYIIHRSENVLQNLQETYINDDLQEMNSTPRVGNMDLILKKTQLKWKKYNLNNTQIPFPSVAQESNYHNVQEQKPWELFIYDLWILTCTSRRFQLMILLLIQGFHIIFQPFIAYFYCTSWELMSLATGYSVYHLHVLFDLRYDTVKTIAKTSQIQQLVPEVKISSTKEEERKKKM